jgi:hypothetical protein
MSSLSWTVARLAIIVCVACGNRDGGPRGPFHMRDTPTKVKTRQLVAADAWPLGAPISVALSPDATKVAYTTADAALFVRPLAGRDAKRWSTGALEGAVAIYVAGFFSDGSLAVLSTTADNAWRLHRLTEAGAATLVHSSPVRLYAAISPVGDRTIVATASSISEVLPSGLREIVRMKEDHIVAIAISPDGTRIANMRSPKFEVTEMVHVTTMDGAELGQQQRFGSSPGYGNELLAWIDNERFVFAGGDAANEEHGIQVFGAGATDGLPETRDVWPINSYVGLGSAAKGVLLVVRGTVTPRVLTRADAAKALAPAVNANATRVIGWTADNRLVTASGFWREERIMRENQPWPGTKPGDSGDAVAGDAVILHRMDSNGLVVERLDAAGKRTRIRSMSLAESRWRPQLVRCAGEQAAPCVFELVEHAHTSYVEVDPATGKHGATLHKHEILYPNGPTPNAALSPDGKLLAVVDQSAMVTLVANGTPKAVPLEGVGAIDSVAFGANDELWIAAREVRGRPFAILRLALDRATLQLRIVHVIDDAMRSFERPTPSRDRSRFAVGARELRTEITRVDGL